MWARLPQIPTVLPFSGPNWARKGQHGGDLRDGHHAPTGSFGRLVYWSDQW